MPETDSTPLPASGKRVSELIRVATLDGDVSVQDVTTDLVLAAAAIMVAVQNSGADSSPPIQGSSELAQAMHQVSVLATKMRGAMPEEAS